MRAAEQFLLQQQEPDGCWRDYQLEPGASEAWTTAIVCWSLACVQPASIPAPAVRAALNALHALQKPTGWGYNRHTASDADSTAWTCRVLDALQAPHHTPLTSILQQFIQSNGCTETFLGKERFGSWCGHHADVQPMIGMALVKVYAITPDQELAVFIRQLRGQCILSASQELWPSFWWTTDAYAIACNLEFLQTSGGIPATIRSSAANWLLQAPAALSAFETAQLLMIALLTGSPVDNYFDQLLCTQLDDGSWPSSEVLLVPSQFNHPTVSSPAYSDIRRLMSTAMALISLKTILAATRQFMN